MKNLFDKICLVAFRYREFLNILSCFVLLNAWPGILRTIDPTAAPIDIGVTSGIVLACITLQIFKSVTWGLIKSIWPMFATYSSTKFESDFNNLSPCQRVIIYLSFYLAFPVLLVLILKAYL